MTELWNWRIEGRVAATEIRPALAEALGVRCCRSARRPRGPAAVRGDLRRLAGAASSRRSWTATGTGRARRGGRQSPRSPAGYAVPVCCRTTPSTPGGTCWSPPTARSVRCTSTSGTPTTARSCPTSGSVPCSAPVPGLVAVPPLALGAGLGATRPRRGLTGTADHQLVEQGAGGLGDRGHRGVERRGVVRGRRPEPRDLPDVLQRRRLDVRVRDGRRRTACAAS